MQPATNSLGGSRRYGCACRRPPKIAAAMKPVTGGAIGGDFAEHRTRADVAFAAVVDAGHCDVFGLLRIGRRMAAGALRADMRGVRKLRAWHPHLREAYRCNRPARLLGNALSDVAGGADFTLAEQLIECAPSFGVSDRQHVLA